MMSHEKIKYEHNGMQRLLRALRDGELREIKPEVKGLNGISYPKVESLTGFSRKKTLEMLSTLSMDGILIKEFIGNLLICPICGSPAFTITPTCPLCGSSKIIGDSALEHLDCGYVDFERNFKKDGKLICPKCGKSLTAIGVDYRRPGRFYSCSSCNSKFTEPKYIVKCGKCGAVSDLLDLKVTKINSYKFNPDSINILKLSTIDLKPVMDLLRSAGWTVEKRKSITGRSGVTYIFSLVASRKHSTMKKPEILIDMIMSDKLIDEAQILPFIAKIMDIDAENVIVACSPRLNRAANNLLKYYNVAVVEGSTLEELTKVLTKKIKELLVTRMKAEINALKEAIKELESENTLIFPFLSQVI